MTAEGGGLRAGRLSWLGSRRGDHSLARRPERLLLSVAALRCRGPGEGRKGKSGSKMREYEAPKVTELGSLDELTEARIYKNAGSGDVIIIDGETIPVPGGSITGTS
jgi:hypothetical protein